MLDFPVCFFIQFMLSISRSFWKTPLYVWERTREKKANKFLALFWFFFFLLYGPLRERVSGTLGVEFRDFTLKTTGMVGKAHTWETWVLTCDLRNVFPLSQPLLPPSENKWFGLSHGQNLFQLWHSQLSVLSELVFNGTDVFCTFFCFLFIPILLDQTLTELG